jgi:membrane associated rhomboid family serine protease
VFDLVNALAAIAAVTVALALSSLDRRTAVLLGATGGLAGNFLTWLAVPSLWDRWAVVPWVAAVAGTVLLIAGWSAVRAYSGLFEPPRADETDTGALLTVGGSGHRS